MRAVWDALLALAAVVQESRVSLGPLREQYKKLHEEVREFYTMAPEVAKAHKLSISEAAAVVKVGAMSQPRRVLCVLPLLLLDRRPALSILYSPRS